MLRRRICQHFLSKLSLHNYLVEVELPDDLIVHAVFITAVGTLYVDLLRLVLVPSDDTGVLEVFFGPLVPVDACEELFLARDTRNTHIIVAVALDGHRIDSPELVSTVAIRLLPGLSVVFGRVVIDLLQEVVEGLFVALVVVLANARIVFILLPSLLLVLIELLLDVLLELLRVLMVTQFLHNEVFIILVITGGTATRSDGIASLQAEVGASLEQQRLAPSFGTPTLKIGLLLLLLLSLFFFNFRLLCIFHSLRLSPVSEHIRNKSFSGAFGNEVLGDADLEARFTRIFIVIVEVFKIILLLGL